MSEPARRIEVTGEPQRRIEPEEFAASIGAEPLICRHCKCKNHPHWHKKYKGLCSNCSNVGVDDFEQRIAALEAENAAMANDLASSRRTIGMLSECANRFADENAALWAEVERLKSELKQAIEQLPRGSGHD